MSDLLKETLNELAFRGKELSDSFKITSNPTADLVEIHKRLFSLYEPSSDDISFYADQYKLLDLVKKKLI